jgi:predicted small metal-binding protein
MGRKYIDCRDHPSEKNCSLTIAADSETELLEAAVQHAVAVHGHKDTPKFREEMRKELKEGMPRG